MKAQYRFWIRYNVEGSNNEKTIVDYSESESQSRENLQALYGKEIKIDILEIQNQGEVKTAYQFHYGMGHSL